MSNWSNSSNSNKGGYRNLVVYQLAVIIFDLNDLFVKRHIDPRSRTKDQMEQAGRSGKQNIVEASLIRSLEGNIKLTGVSRGSFGELLEDYEDFLRTRGLSLWEKDSPRVREIRAIRISPNSTNSSNWSNWTNSPEAFANLLTTLLHLENYLLDQLIRKLEEKFVNEGGFRENLFRRRQERKNK